MSPVNQAAKQPILVELSPDLSSSPKSMFVAPSELYNDEDQSDSDKIAGPFESVMADQATGSLLEDRDAYLFIKMAPYPMSLAQYLLRDEKGNDTNNRNMHCFHEKISVRILIGILDGLEYLHRRKIIHRDLKPANVFLATLDSSEPPVFGYSSCNECPSNALYVCPKIGDFGLVTSLASHASTDSSRAEEEEQDGDLDDVFEPREDTEEEQDDTDSDETESEQVGTLFYRPPYQPKAPSITCPKLDVYALGIVAAELVLKFRSDHERATVLSNIRAGKFPELGALEEGIKWMTRANREERWDCKQVKEWLLKLEKELA